VIYLALDRINRSIEKAVPPVGPELPLPPVGPELPLPPVAGATEGMQ
jgi:multidrug efflux pump